MSRCSTSKGGASGSPAIAAWWARRTRREDLDLTRQSDVRRWVADRRPEAVFVAAARVGGILANDTHPIEFLYENLMIAANVLEASARANVAKLMHLGSSCIYPRHSPQPISEGALLTGLLEPTNEAYAIAKIAGLKLAQAYRRQEGRDFISAMPTNLYGPGDNFDLASSHVLPALMRKAHDAKLSGASDMTVWGSGAPRREFLHVDDCAEALVFLMTRYSDALRVNVGCGEDQTIATLTQAVADAAMKMAGFYAKDVVSSLQIVPVHGPDTQRVVGDRARWVHRQFMHEQRVGVMPMLDLKIAPHAQRGQE